MTGKTENSPGSGPGSMKITVTKNGPLVVSGGVPLSEEEICSEGEGYYKRTKTWPVQQTYALCRCGKSKTLPFCDGTHERVRFSGTETAGTEPYLRHPQKTQGTELELDDYEHLCVHARFCMRSGGVWALTGRSHIPEARDTAVELACNCPSGRLVIRDRSNGKAIEPELEKSIAIIENPAEGEHGPIWVRGGIPVVSADGKAYTVRNRVTLCRCGRSHNKPFCDGSHLQH